MVSCSEYETLTDNVPSSQLRFQVNIPEEVGGAETRGAALTNDNLTTLGLVGLSYPTGASYSSASPNSYIVNDDVTKNGNFWDSHYSWPGPTRNISIFAYAPYATATNGITISNGAQQGIPTLTYRVPENATNQPDILVSNSHIDVPGDSYSTLPLTFDHICARVQVRAGELGMPSGTISSIEFQRIRTEGTFSLENSTGSWTVNTASTGTVKATAITPSGAPDQELAAGTKTFMMIPQEIPDNAYLDITYSTGDKAHYSRQISGTWEKGQTYVYYIDKLVSIKEFSSSGLYTYTVPVDGTYKLEVYGAQGDDNVTNRGYGGKGGYAWGNTKLKKNDILYVCVGGYPASVGTGAYNGGGKAGAANGTGGGGATHIANIQQGDGTLVNYESTYTTEVLIVAGGGGGANGGGLAAAGAGGGTTGGVGANQKGNSYVIAGAGTQTGGGSGVQNGQNGSFGKGGDAAVYGTSGGSPDYGGGGGGGLYGGGSCGGSGAGGGGSGYTNPTLLVSDTYGMQSGVRTKGGFARITLVQAD